MSQINELALDHGPDAMVRWKTSTNKPRLAVAERKLLTKEIYNALPIRMPQSYPRQRNYYGLYYFQQTRSHVWHESLNEAHAMMLLDHTQMITAIAAQPMEIAFTDGRKHTPDLLALHADGRQVVYDIKPLDRVNVEVTEQFAKTLAICRTVGWDYQILTGLPVLVQKNLTHLNRFKHPLFAPPETSIVALLDLLTEPVEFDKAAAFLRPDALPDGRAALCHILWKRHVVTNLNQRLNPATLIERNSHVSA